jgi:hypothetical protein
VAQADALSFDDLIPAKPQGRAYGPGAPESGQQATPDQQTYATANANTAPDPATVGKTADNPSYDTPSLSGAPDSYHVTPQGQLSDPHPALNLKFDDLIPHRSVGADVAEGYGSGLSKGIAGLADTIEAASPLGTVMRALSIASDPLSTHMQGPIPTLFGQNATPHFTPQTGKGHFAQTLGEMTPAALSEGSGLSRVMNVVGPTIGSEMAGGAAHALGVSPQVEQAARAVGAVAGGVGASARLNPQATSPDEVVANALARRTGVDPDQMAAQANALRASGVSPSVLDVTGPKGLRLLRAVGVTNDDAGEALQNNALAVSSTTKPAVMARTRDLAGGPTTADQLAADLNTARTTEARSTYEAPYAASIDLKDPNIIQALRDHEGASAINRAITAARARMDYKAMADLQALKVTADGPTGNGQVWPTTGRALDRVQIAFGNKGAALAQNGSNDIASGMFKRQDLINSALDNVDGLQPARAAFRAKSQAIDILTKPGVRKDPFSTDPSDYKAWVDSLPPEAQHANQVAIRQDILDTLGGQRAGTAGSIDELATSQYAKQNLAAALGDKEAGDYLGNLSARLAQRGNATFVSPNGGSRTAVLQNDAGNALGRAVSVADTAHKVATGNVVGLAAKAAAWLKTRGLSDSDATELAQASVDPGRLDSVISAIRQLKDPETARGFVNFRGGLIGAAGAL